MTDFQQPYQLLDDAANRNPRRLAIADGQQEISTDDLRESVRRVASALRRRGAQPGQIIALNLGPAASAAFSLAANHEGMVSCGWTSTFNINTIVDVTWLATSRPLTGFPAERQIVVGPDFFAELREFDEHVDPRLFESEDALFRIALSSGTTGRPKAIPYTVAQNLSRAIQSVDRWSDSGQPMSLFTPRLGVGWHAWFASLVRDQAYIAPSDIATNVSLIRDHGVTSIVGTPVHLTALTRYLKNSPSPLTTLTRATVVGAPASEALVRNFRAVTNIELGNVYSSSEFGGVAARLGSAVDPTDMGEILPGVEVNIVDETTHLTVPDGEPGLVRVRRPGMVTGYLNDPEASAVAFRDGWFYPGDRGFVRDGHLYFAGRASETINASGAKIDPTVIDNAFLERQEILDCAAFAVNGKFDLVSVGIAYVSAEELNEFELMESMRSVLGAAVPMVYRRVDEIPRGEAGKALRGELTERFSEKG